MSFTGNEAMNSVAAMGQLKSDDFVRFTLRNGSMKVLFVGNSITRHGVRPEIGWNHDWGMAASSMEKDYVHQVIKGLEQRGIHADYAIAQVADWEIRFPEDLAPLEAHYQAARDFQADLVIIRVGENMKKDCIQEGKPYFDRMIRFFLTNPNAKVIVTDSFWAHPVRDPFIREICEERGYTLCKISDLEQNSKTMALGEYEHKGVSVHPSDYGMKQIAKRILEKI